MRFVIFGVAAATLSLARLSAAVEHVELESVWSHAAPAAARGKSVADWLAETASRAGLSAEEAAALTKSLQSSGSFRYAETPAGLFLANAETGLFIAGWNRGQPSILSFYHFPTGTEWLSGRRGSLWEIDWKAPDTVRWSSADLAAPACALKFSGDEAVVTMAWPEKAIGEKGGASVQAEIRLPANDSVPRYFLNVENGSPVAGIWSVRFPMLNGVGRSGKVDAVAGTLGTSRLVRNFSGEIRDHLFAEQVRSVTMGNSSLYVAAEDPKNWQKYYHYKAGDVLDLSLLPEDTAVPGKSYRQPFPILAGPIGGDWFDAAQRYRRWALQQSWASRGPVNTWKGPGQKMADTMIWLQTLSPQANNVPAQIESLLTLNGRLGIPAGVHYYQWWGGNAFSPQILTAGFRPGLPEGWETLQKGGLAVLPYFNVLYWRAGERDVQKKTKWPDVKVEPGFAAVKSAACQPYPGVEGDDTADEKFEIYGDHYVVHGGNNAMVPMCRFTPEWQEHLLAIAKKIEQSGVDMVYLDQGGVPPRSPCFNPAHGHALGGGGQWAEGTRRLIERIKFGTGRELGICCEAAFEGYLDLVEVQFMHYWPWLAKKDALCPLFESIYHDHTLFMGAVKQHPDATAYAIDVGTRLLHGNEFRAEARMFDDPKFAGQVAFVTRMARLRKAGALYLATGQLVRPPDWKKTPGRVKADWVVKDGVVKQTIGYPAMERAAFRLDDGSEAVFVVNFSDQPSEAFLDLADWSGGAALTVTHSDGSQTQADAGAPIAAPARDGFMITKAK